MTVEHIFISPAGGAPQESCSNISVQAGQGIVGDRNFGKHDYPGRNFTLVEVEEIERFCAETGQAVDLARTRRNVITRGIRLNDLVGKEFTLGTARFLGVELCEPCADMGNAFATAQISAPEVVRRWVGKAGLRADVLSDGAIAVGDRIDGAA